MLKKKIVNAPVWNAQKYNVHSKCSSTDISVGSQQPQRIDLTQNGWQNNNT